MKFLRITFRCFGPFEDQTLDFSGQEGLHVVFGPNEAGKSSALRGINSFLFGFPLQSSDGFRFQYSQFRIRASLENSLGKTLECVRRKGKKATLLTCDEKTEVAESSLSQFLGGLQQQQFEQLFGLDLRRLILGGQEIAKGQGDLGEALFAAGAGLAGIRALAKSLEERQNALYKFRGQAPPINKALADYNEQLCAVRQNTLPPEKYVAAAVAARETEEKAEKLRCERSNVRSQLSHLRRCRDSMATIVLLQGARQRLEQVADAPLLAIDFESKLSAAREKREIARDKLKHLSAQKEELERKLRDAEPPATALAEEAEIDEIKRLVGADAMLQIEAIKADTRRSEEEGKARDIFRELTGTTAWDQMDHLKPRLDDERRITELANEHAAVLQGGTNADAKARIVGEEHAVAVDQQSKLSATIDSAPWIAAVESITALGPLEQNARTHQSEAASAELRLADEFARLQPRVPGMWTDAVSVQVPSNETVTLFRQQFDDVQREIRSATEERAQIDREINSVSEQLAVTAGAEPMPTATDLASARRDRDGGLLLIRRRLTEQPDVSMEEEFTNRHAPGKPLIDAVEVTVRRSDNLADRLRHEADRVAKWQTQDQKRGILQERRQQLTNDLNTAEARRDRIEQDWQAAWQAAGINPECPEAMLGWLIRWQRFIEQVAAWKDHRQKCQENERQITLLRQHLAEACPFTQNTKTLADGLALARRAIIEAKDNNTTAERLNGEVLRLRAELTTAEAEAKRAQERQVRWTNDWSSAVAFLGLRDSHASVKTVQDYLKRIAEMQQHLTNMRIKAARVKEIHRERVSLLQRLTALRQRLDSTAEPSRDDSLDADFRQVDSALKAARDSRTQHEELDRQLKKVVLDIETATEALRTADASLTVLAGQAQVTDVEAIALAVQRSKERALAARDVQEQEKALAQITSGESLELFIASALGERDLENNIDQLNRREQELDPEISAAEKQALQSEQVIDEYQGASDAAAHAKQQAELISSRLQELVAEYGALHLASAVLERAKERYRLRHQDNMLSRAGDFFKTLTDQAFQGLDIDNEEGDDVLKAVRAAGHPNSRVPVSGLSDGTRDQLFLALRLAGIEQHLQDREPVPLIVDDVLMTFDDIRAHSTLKCLTELAAKTQVLLFTHHLYLVDLAKAVNPHAVVHELVPYRLSGNESESRDQSNSVDGKLLVGKSRMKVT